MTNQRIIAASLLFGLWSALVFAHLAPVSDLVEAIKFGLAGLGVYHVTTSLQAVQKP